MGTAVIEMRPGTGLVGRSKKPGGDRQIGFRVSEERYLELEDIAHGMGLDLSNFLRLMIAENLPTYRQRVREIREREARSKE